FGAVARSIALLVLLSGCGLATFTGCQDSALPGAGPAKTVETTKTAALSSEDVLKKRVDDAIDFTRDRHLDPSRNNAWQIIHGVLAYGNELQLSVDGKLYPAVDWILDGGKFKGWNLVPAEKGVESIMDPGNKVGEGHEDQWIGYISQTGISLDHPVRVGDKDFKVRDMLTQAQWDMREGMEATF